MEPSFRINEFLIGRDHEFARLRDRFNAGGGITLIAGEPGIGKTRLLIEIERFVQESGAAVLRGGSVNAAGMPPYLTFIEAIGDFLRGDNSAELQTFLDEQGAALAVILPELRSRSKLQPEPLGLTVDEARLRLFETVVRLTAVVSSKRRAVLILDDLQWADSASIDLLTHIVRRSTSPAFSIVGADRASEPQFNPALGRGLAELNRLRKLATISLRRLDIDQLAILTRALLGGTGSIDL